VNSDGVDAAHAGLLKSSQAGGRPPSPAHRQSLPH
jgi:hypothetical protein